jgi:hypothetical protein
MKKRISNILGSSVMLLCLCSACSTESILDTGKNIEIGNNVQINLSEEPYLAEKPATRATAMWNKTIDLGNNMICEVTLRPDTTNLSPNKATRAAMSEGHYNIFVFDASGHKLTGTDKTLSGTVTNGKFVPDVNKYIRLEQGTYTFVCTNMDNMDDNGQLIVERKAENPMLGYVTQYISGSGLKEISFSMKHLAARIRTEVTSYTVYATNLKAHHDLGSYFALPQYFDYKGNPIDHTATASELSQYNNTGYREVNMPLKKIGDQKFSSIVKPFKVTSDYMYFAGTSANTTGQWFDLGAKGPLYGGFVNYASNIYDSNYPIRMNHSYVCTLNFKTKRPLYLYQDGTVGYLADKADRTPVAVVVKEKTETEDGLAAALKEAGEQQWNVTPGIKYNISPISYSYNNTYSDMLGYQYTWDAAYTKNNVVKATSNDYPAFKAAAEYNPGVNVTDGLVGRKWFLPSQGQFKYLYTLGGTDVSTLNGRYNTAVNTNGDKIAQAFTDAGGETLVGKKHWVSSELDERFSPVITIYPSGMLHGGTTKTAKFHVRPFIFF